MTEIESEIHKYISEVGDFKKAVSTVMDLDTTSVNCREHSMWSTKGHI